MIKSLEELNVTPGPWTCAQSANTYGVYNIFQAYSEWVPRSERPIGYLATIKLHDFNNAKLIGFAPALYGALRNLVLDMQDTCMDCNPETGEEYATSAFARELLEEISEACK